MDPPLLRLRPGDRALAGDELVQVERPATLSEVCVRISATNELRVVPIATLRSIPSGGTRRGPDWQSASPEDRRTATRRLIAIRPLIGRRRSREYVAERAGAFHVHPATLYEWKALFETSGMVTALLPRKRGEPAGSRRVNAVAESIMQREIEVEYTRSKTSRKVEATRFDEAFSAVVIQCKSAGVRAPHFNTFRSRIKQYRGEQRQQARDRAAARSAEAHSPRGPGPIRGADSPLAVGQIDHTTLDVMIVDETYRIPIGRPWITVLIDVYSRVVLGFFVSIRHASAAAVGRCLAHAFLPKDRWLRDRGLGISWPVWGVVRIIHADNAREFRGLMLKAASQEYGSSLRFRPVQQPRYGSYIERHLKTTLTTIHTLPGTTFSTPFERRDYDSESLAVMTIGALERWLALFFDKYHRSIHSSLGTTPLKRFAEGLLPGPNGPGAGYPPILTDARKLRIDLLPYEWRIVHPRGIVHFAGVDYQSDILRLFARDYASPETNGPSERLRFRRDPADISVIYHWDATLGEYIDVGYADPSHPAMSLWEWKARRAAVTARGADVRDEQAVFDDSVQMSTIVSEQTQSTANKRSRSRKGIRAALREAEAAAHELRAIESIEPRTGSSAIEAAMLEPGRTQIEDAPELSLDPILDVALDEADEDVTPFPVQPNAPLPEW